MLFDVADIQAPSFMARSRFEWVRLRFVRLFRWWLDSVEPTILGHNESAVRGGTEMPNCLRAANILHSPSNGFSSCFLRIRLRVGISTPGLLVFAWDFSQDPALLPRPIVSE